MRTRPARATASADRDQIGVGAWARTGISRMLVIIALPLASVSLLAGPVAGRASAATTRDPLQVRITSLTPGTIPRRGPITVTGTVRNVSKETWSSINVYPQTSHDPMVDATELESAATSDPMTTGIGDRMLSAGTSIGDLAPGATATFTLTLRSLAASGQISGQPGVYWLGVQALGSGNGTNDNVADGRARTFLPLVRAATAGRARVALVVPIRRTIRRAEDGLLLRPQALANAVAPGGQLDDLLEFAQAAGAEPLTWLVDPAVLDAVTSVVEGNPGLDLLAPTPGSSPSATPTGSSSPTQTPSATASASASPSSDASGSASPSGTPTPQLPSPAGNPGHGVSVRDEQRAADWLQRWTVRTTGRSVLSLPYADVDVSALAGHHRPLLQRAWTLGDQVLSPLGLVGQHAVAPFDGYLDPDATHALTTGTTVLLGDHGTSPLTSVADTAGLRIAYVDTDASSGGPSPGPTTDSLAMRQRILAEAALRAQHHDHRTLIVQFPRQWDPGDAAASAAFFSGLDTSWLTLTDLPNGTATGQASIPWPASAKSRLVQTQNVAVAAQLSRLATTTDDLIPGEDTIASQIRAGGLAAASQWARVQPVTARLRAYALLRSVRADLATIQVEGSSFVTLSGGSGVLTVAVVNGLDHPVVLRLHAKADDSRIHLTAPPLIRLAAGQRTTVRLQADARTVGVHEVVLSPVASDGGHVGTPLLFSLRTSQIGNFFWGILIAAMVVVGLLILRRIRQRLRSHRWRQ